jgi:hypothetical protein
MRFPLRHLRALCCTLLGLLAALGGGACAGTPLPEPPDELPRPDFTRLFTEDSTLTPTTAPMSTEVAIPVVPGAVQAGTTLLFINVDAPGVAIQRSGPVAGKTYVRLPASVGDRLRTLFVSDRAHSPPLDLEAQPPRVANDLVLTFRQLADTSLPCLRITPPESLVLSGRRGELTITNQCDVAVGLSRAALRTGTEGLQLVAAPSAIAAGAQVALSLEDTQEPGSSERLDILLLDVAAVDGRSGRYAIDVFSDLK